MRLDAVLRWAALQWMPLRWALGASLVAWQRGRACIACSGTAAAAWAAASTPRRTVFSPRAWNAMICSVSIATSDLFNRGTPLLACHLTHALAPPASRPPPSNCVREFVKDRTGFDGRIGTNWLAQLSKSLGLSVEPWVRALQGTQVRSAGRLTAAADG